MNTVQKNPLKIQEMFSSIARRYDLLNNLLSLGRDRHWRRFAVKQLPDKQDALFLDMATGTGDIAIEIARQYPYGTRIIGMDFSSEMLRLGNEKIKKTGYDDRIELRYGDITSIPYNSDTFDAAIIAFGIRNIPDYHQGIAEMSRVIKKGGRLVILEFTSIQSKPFRKIFRWYLKYILPFIGGIISGKRGAYKYLSNSVMDFPSPEGLKKIMEQAGLKNVHYHRLTFSIVTVHIGEK
jgi:demethylmenaquinone methyltransferase/2-methoxy-6-polyprenyl-1,4-benzoquinol methylase